MKRKFLIVLAILAVACWVGSASATTTVLSQDTGLTASFSTGTNTLSTILSDPFKDLATVTPSATATFTLDLTHHQLDITFTNAQITAATSASQVLAALWWTSGQSAVQIAGQFGSASGTLENGTFPVTIPATTMSSVWGYASNGPWFINGQYAGNQGVSAVGLKYGFVPLDGSNSNNVDGITYSILPTQATFPDGLANGPWTDHTVSIILNLASNVTSYSFSDPEAWWGTNDKGSAVPIPPTALLLGSGLLGLGLIGWRRKKG